MSNKANTKYPSSVLIKSASPLDLGELKSLLKAAEIRVLEEPSSNSNANILSLTTQENLTKLESLSDALQTLVLISDPSMAAAALRYRPGGLLLRENASEELVTAVESVIEGRFYLDENLLAVQREDDGPDSVSQVLSTKLHQSRLPTDLVPRPELGG